MNKKIFTISVVTLLLDQISKSVIDLYIKLDEVIKVFKGFYLTNLDNTGCAFSLLENKSYLLAIIGVVIIFALISIIKDYKSNKLTNLSFGLLFGGILGNLSDRVFLGYVRDFIGVGSFPVFNFADMFICLGVACLILETFLERNKDDSNSRQKRKNR